MASVTGPATWPRSSDGVEPATEAPGFVPIRCVTWAVEDAADEAIAPNAEGRLFVLATVDGWPSAMVDARAESADGVAEAVMASRRRACERRPGSTPALLPKLR